MPLRVTKEYSIEEENVKKVHKKMSKSGHYQKVRRPTGLEIYNDAAKILEELLEKRIDRDVRVARSRRNRTDPTKQRESVISTGGEITVSRCKTMPSRYRENVLNEIKKRGEDEEEIIVEKKKKSKHTVTGFVFESDSSANVTEGESDAEDTNVTKNRKKKSLFKRAKENLIRSFNRDQKEGFGKPFTENKESSSTKKKKTKKKSDSIVRESKRSVKGRLNEDKKSIDYVEVVDYRHSKPSSSTEVISHKSRSGSMSRSSLIEAIRKPFRKSKSVRYEDDDEPIPKPRADTTNGMKSVSVKDENAHDEPYVGFSPSLPRPFPGTNRPNDSKLSPISTDQSTIPSSSDLGQGGTLSSNASTVYPNSSDYNNSVGSLNQLPSVKSNILDSPGEDFEFIDFDDKEKRKSIVKYHGSEGLLNLQWLAEQTASAKAFDFEIDEHSVSTQRPDGQVETVTTVTATRTVILAGVKEEEEDDDNDGRSQYDNEETNKDEIYGKIAQKLIEMADTYSTNVSDTEAHRDTAAAEDAPLTDLEKEIIACLRSSGDRYAKKMEDQLDAFKTAVAEDAYGRFKSTVENSMGHELSWNTLALLFYATKGVVSAVGKGSQVATQAKEFTLKYISDTFVSWIMEQGGFDSMLSASESDPELD